MNSLLSDASPDQTGCRIIDITEMYKCVALRPIQNRLSYF